jgi:hypothetical protein
MGRTRDILGHVNVEIAQRQRKCHRSRGKHNIPKDTAHLAVKVGPFAARKNYCADCAGPILHRAKTRLAEMERALNSTT